MKSRLISFFIAILFLSHTARTQAQKTTLKWKIIAPGIWKSTIGKPQVIDLLKAANIHPRKKALENLGEMNFPLPQDDCHAEMQDGKVYLRFPLEKDEQIFGLGLHFKTVNQRGRILNLHVDHYGGKDDGRTHAPVPFYISSKGYGVLINSARYITVYAGTAVRKDSKHPPKVYDRNTDKNWQAQPYSDEVDVLVPASGTEVYVFAGKTPMEVVERYNLYNGGVYCHLSGVWVLPREFLHYPLKKMCVMRWKLFKSIIFHLTSLDWSQGGKVNPIPVLLNGIHLGFPILLSLLKRC